MKISMRLFKRYKNGRFLSWYVEFDGGTRISLRTGNETEARRAYRKIEREYFKGRLAILTGQCIKTLGGFRDEYLEWAEEAIPSRSTFRANRLALKKLISVAGESIKLNKIGHKHIDMMVVECRKNGNKIGSINNYIRHVKAVLNKSVEWEYVKENPLRKVRQLRQKKSIPKYLRESDISRLLAGIKDIDLRRYVTAYIATGRRRSELVGLNWSDISLQAGYYIIRKSKSHLERSYDINGLFRAVLEAIGPKDSGPVFDRWRHPDTVSHQVKKALRAAGYGHLTLHSLRHTFASMAASNGKSILQIQELLGHSEIKATMIYTHLVDGESSFEVNIGPVDLNG